MRCVSSWERLAAATARSPATAHSEKGTMSAAAPLPLGLYVHVPWCLRKCPYCDFNSHAVADSLPEAAYVDALLADLDADLADQPEDRPVGSVFIGGGTPSLFSGATVTRLLSGIRTRLALEPDCEITLEANPGAIDSGHFAAYRAAGVNRLSIGIQSLSDAMLRALGRIHDSDQARDAVRTARWAGFDNINLDLMYALPRQGLDQAEADLRAVLDLAPDHCSYYQLTLEPNTAFAATPPDLPDPDLAADMQDLGLALLADAGFDQYEVSAHARPGRRCRHNLAYWTFGDYLGIGAGAHAKRTDPSSGQARRTAKQRHPARYLATAATAERIQSSRVLDPADLTLEFALNAMRLNDGVPASLFSARTGLRLTRITQAADAARSDGLLDPDPDQLRPTVLGRRFLNDLVRYFDED